MLFELRDTGLLKIFFADALDPAQAPPTIRRLTTFALTSSAASPPPAPLASHSTFVPYISPSGSASSSSRTPSGSRKYSDVPLASW